MENIRQEEIREVELTNLVRNISSIRYTPLDDKNFRAIFSIDNTLHINSDLLGKNYLDFLTTFYTSHSGFKNLQNSYREFITRYKSYTGPIPHEECPLITKPISCRESLNIGDLYGLFEKLDREYISYYWKIPSRSRKSFEARLLNVANTLQREDKYVPFGGSIQSVVEIDNDTPNELWNLHRNLPSEIFRLLKNLLFVESLNDFMGKDLTDMRHAFIFYRDSRTNKRKDIFISDPNVDEIIRNNYSGRNYEYNILPSLRDVRKMLPGEDILDLLLSAKINSKVYSTLLATLNFLYDPRYSEFENKYNSSSWDFNIWGPVKYSELEM